METAENGSSATAGKASAGKPATAGKLATASKPTSAGKLNSAGYIPCPHLYISCPLSLTFYLHRLPLPPRGRKAPRLMLADSGEDFHYRKHEIGRTAHAAGLKSRPPGV